MIGASLRAVNELVAKAHASSPLLAAQQQSLPRLVAVSKTKPVEDIIEAYRSGQRHFGENYVQELVDKSNDPQILQECPDIRWHYIGNVQSNKVNKLAQIRNLFLVETVDSEKIATGLNRAATSHSLTEKLGVLVQVNTSGEDQKNGISPQLAPELSKFICEKCERLNFRGFMTIGALAHSRAAAGDNKESSGENPDFTILRDVRIQFCVETGRGESELELSMGMSTDFEEAIRAGSTNVRVGSAIFGARNYKN